VLAIGQTSVTSAAVAPASGLGWLARCGLLRSLPRLRGLLRALLRRRAIRELEVADLGEQPFARVDVARRRARACRPTSFGAPAIVASQSKTSPRLDAAGAVLVERLALTARIGTSAWPNAPT
jgi:hypothetical protein